MYKVNSQTISENYKAEAAPLKEWKFQIANGNTGEKTISDPLLDTFDAAQERAKSEFLKNAYSLNTVRFSTYRTDLYKNMVISIYGTPYLVKSLSFTSDEKALKTSVKAVRYG